MLLALVFFCGLFFYACSAKAQTVTEDTQQQIEELEEKAEKYREIIETKQKQQQSLNNQIDIMDGNIGKFRTEIEINKKKIDDLNSKISRKQAEIKDKENLIVFQKALLADLLRSLYDAQGESFMSAVLIGGDDSPLASRKDSFVLTVKKINSVLQELKVFKEGLERDRTVLEGEKEKLTKLHIDLKEKSENMEIAKVQKEDLLLKTQGEEAKYQKLLEKVEEQKRELLSIDELYSASGLSIDDFEKPDSKYYASTSWYYSQRDPSWANVKIGNSNSLLKDYGCAVSSVAMVFTKLGSSITPKDLSQKDQYFQWDLIAWPKSWKDITLSSSGSLHGNMSWSKIDSEIKTDNPVIIYIGKSGGNGGHYVVVHHKDDKGRYVVHDPYFGPNIFLNTSKALVGAMGQNTSTYTDQMIIYNN